MYKAVIVDDERKICSLIVELGDWKRFQIEVAQICTDGEEALETICRIHPDIVLTDVRMPVFDGLELIRRTSEKGLHPAFIIISGYKYFEYAYSALKYGVIDYLLKPIDEKQLNEVLEKTCQILKERRRVETAENELRRINRHIELNNRKKMFENLFDHGDGFPDTAEELERIYQKNFPREAMQVFFLKTNRDLEEESNILLAQKIEEVIRRIFKGQSEDQREQSSMQICMEVLHGGLAVILNFHTEESRKVRSLLQTMLFDILDVVELFGNSQVSLGLSSVVNDLSELPEAAREAEEAEAAKVVLGTNRILDLSEQRFSHLTLEQIFTDSSRRSLENAIETLSQEAMEGWMDRMEKMMDKRPPLHPSVVLGLRDSIHAELENYARLHRLDDFEDFSRDWYSETGQASGLSNFFWCMRDLIEGQMEIWRTSRESEEKLPIRLAKAYIEEHYAETLTLEAVAEEVGLSQAYFSSQFKRVEGRTFSDYLTDVRMEAAKELLADTNLNNYQIASRIGYSDEKYFGKVFKKEVGIRPGEYRKLYYRG